MDREQFQLRGAKESMDQCQGSHLHVYLDLLSSCVQPEESPAIAFLSFFLSFSFTILSPPTLQVSWPLSNSY
jgi:hypothetical protein